MGTIMGRQRVNLLLPLVVIMLLIYSVVPYIAKSAGGEIEVDLKTMVGNTVGALVTEENINDTSPSSPAIEVILTLEGENNWAHDINSKKKLIRDSMVADIDSTIWDSYKGGIVIDDITSPSNTLTLKLPKLAYTISNNQTITLNLSSALVENWEGQVKPVSFTIYAKPRMTLTGSAFGATTEDIAKGGKEIELNLLNAKWDKTNIFKTTQLNRILDQFQYRNGSGTYLKWELTQYLKTRDPNQYVSIENDDRTLKFKLPPVPSTVLYNVGMNEFVLFNESLAEPQLLIGAYIIDKVNGFDTGSRLFGFGTSLPLLINQASGFTLSTTNVNEKEITNIPDTSSIQPQIILTLNGVLWSLSTDAKKKELIDAMISKNQPEQWEKVKTALKKAIDLGQNPITLSAGQNQAFITIPAVADYYLTDDQTISLNVPYQLLSNDIKLKEQTFTISATPKVLISGSATPVISRTDFIKGGKTVVLTLVNTTWVTDIATNTIRRESLLDGFNWGTLNPIVKARATVTKTNEKVVTIALPPIEKLSSDLNIRYTPNQGLTTTPSGQAFVTDVMDAFAVKAGTTPSATISGTILSNTTEFDIVKGGKSIVITLKDDVWAKDVETNTAKISLSGISLPNPVMDIKRTSDTVVTLTLKSQPGFSLTGDSSVSITIPDELLTVSSGDIILNSAFKIGSAAAELSGTGISVAPVDIQKGGKTLTIKLKNATFKTDASSLGRLSFTNSTEWNKVVTAIYSNANNIKFTNDTVTIKLPAVPNYNSVSGETISVTIPQILLNDASRAIVVAPEIKIGQVANAFLSTGTLSESLIKKQDNYFSIALVGATWDPALPTNKNKLSTLLKGFTTKDQTKEWSTLVTAIQTSGYASLSSDKKVLLIKVPKTINYSIIRDQLLDITIPKSVLADYKFDIPVGTQLRITVPSITTNTTLGALLNADLDAYIKSNGLENIRVLVPEKNVQTISVNTNQLPGTGAEKKSITTIEVAVNSRVNKVVLNVKGKSGEVTREATGSNLFTFVFTNLDKDSELTVSVFGSGSSDPLQPAIYKKIGNGSKVYNELPRTTLTGSYSLYSLLTSKTLLQDILKYYTLDELKVGK